MVQVNPEILVWARETAGLEPDEAAQKLGFMDSKRRSALGRLLALENGEDEPSSSVLRTMAEKYRRPLVTFYFDAPPPKGNRGADFRTMPEPPPKREEAILDALIRDMLARQDMVRALLEDAEDAEPLTWVGSHSVRDGEQRVGQALAEVLNTKVGEFREKPDARAAFGLLRARAGLAGVFVLLKGDLGNYHSAIEPELFRGFSIADQVAPFIVINDRDAPTAWSFTLLHEMAHLLLGQTGVSNNRSDNDTERFCDSVAGSFLLEEDEVALAGLYEGMPLAEADAIISSFARPLNVSHTLVALRAVHAGIFGWSFYRELASFFRAQWGDERRRRREESPGGGGDYYTVRKHRLGSALVSLVERMTASGALSTTKAAHILDVKPAHLRGLFGG